MPLQHEKVIRLRAYQQCDARAITDLFHETVHTINRRDYSEAQVQAWAPLPIDYAAWEARLQRTRPLVAEVAGEIAGFAELQPDGHIDCFYVHKSYQGMGVGGALLAAIERRACCACLPQLSVHASLTAVAFFRRRGFIAIRQNVVVRRGEQLVNVVMAKSL